MPSNNKNLDFVFDYPDQQINQYNSSIARVADAISKENMKLVSYQDSLNLPSASEFEGINNPLKQDLTNLQTSIGQQITRANPLYDRQSNINIKQSVADFKKTNPHYIEAMRMDYQKKLLQDALSKGNINKKEFIYEMRDLEEYGLSYGKANAKKYYFNPRSYKEKFIEGLATKFHNIVGIKSDSEGKRYNNQDATHFFAENYMLDHPDEADAFFYEQIENGLMTKTDDKVDYLVSYLNKIARTSSYVAGSEGASDGFTAMNLVTSNANLVGLNKNGYIPKKNGYTTLTDADTGQTVYLEADAKILTTENNFIMKDGMLQNRATVSVPQIEVISGYEEELQNRMAAINNMDYYKVNYRREGTISVDIMNEVTKIPILSAFEDVAIKDDVYFGLTDKEVQNVMQSMFNNEAVLFTIFDRTSTDAYKIESATPEKDIVLNIDRVNKDSNYKGENFALDYIFKKNKNLPNKIKEGIRDHYITTLAENMPKLMKGETVTVDLLGLDNYLYKDGDSYEVRRDIGLLEKGILNTRLLRQYVHLDNITIKPEDVFFSSNAFLYFKLKPFKTKNVKFEGFNKFGSAMDAFEVDAITSNNATLNLDVYLPLEYSAYNQIEYAKKTAGSKSSKMLQEYFTYTETNRTVPVNEGKLFIDLNNNNQVVSIRGKSMSPESPYYANSDPMAFEKYLSKNENYDSLLLSLTNTPTQSLYALFGDSKSKEDAVTYYFGKEQQGNTELEKTNIIKLYNSLSQRSKKELRKQGKRTIDMRRDAALERAEEQK